MNRFALKTVAATFAFTLIAATAQAADTWSTTKISTQPSGHGAVISWPCPGYPMPGDTLSS